MLAPIVPSTTIVGGILPEAADALGLVAGTSVVLGGGDGPCAALGAAVTAEASNAYCYLGSSSWISFAANAPLHDPRMRTMTFNHVLAGEFVPTATMVAGGGSFEWAAELFGGGMPMSRAQLSAEAAHGRAAEDGLIFLPHLLGERSPYWNPRARGAFVGLARHHGRADLVRGVMEGVAMNLATAQLAFAELGHPFTGVDAIGGGAASDVWLQILADCWGVPVRRLTLVAAANGLGAAVVGGVAVGLFDGFADAQRFRRVAAEFTPDPERHALLRSCHAQFIDAYQRLEPWFDAR